MSSLLDQDIKYLKGVGPVRAAMLGEDLKVFTLGDFIHTFPYKYVDRTMVHTIVNLTEDMPHVQLAGTLLNLQKVGEGRSRRLTAMFTDGTGYIELVWFNGIRQVESHLKVNTPYLLFGKPSAFNGRLKIVHPEMDLLKDGRLPAAAPSLFDTATPDTMPSAPDSAAAGSRGHSLAETLLLKPHYHTTERMKRAFFTSQVISDLMRNAFALIGHRIDETLPDYIRQAHHLIPLPQALAQVHFPPTAEALPAARRRLKFDELFFLQLSILRTARQRQEARNDFIVSRVGPLFNRFYAECLPFPLTDAQKRVVREIRADLRTGRQMNRLVQGDVGSGKTIVAVMAALLLIDAGYQVCIMAPTEILAAQHYASVSRLLEPLGIGCALLMGSLRSRRRRDVLERTRRGEVSLLVGTHALIEPDVVFHNLGMAIIDEQHRFGVKQRAALWDKNVRPPHVLVMTATPIPRTLAMTVYGDLALSVIDELPPGRKPIVTLHRTERTAYDVNALVRRELAAGRQVYIVHPLIEENEKMALRDLETGYRQVLDTYPDYPAAKLHGRMKADEKEAAVAGFVAGTTRILVATTVVEVGVNVPNASVMVIQNAERFGLSQLHQLRGRVGRGADRSYCVLVTKEELSETTRRRLQVMVDTNDGFRIAEEDMRLRGPGDIRGTAQSGLPFTLQIADIVHDADLMQTCRLAARRLLEADPDENLPQNAPVWRELARLTARRTDFTDIS